MTEKQYPELPESGSGRNMTMAAFLRQPPNVKEPIYMAALDKAAIEQQRIIDADRAMRSSRIDELEQLLAEAYQVVGVLLSDTDQFNTDHGTKILDNLSQMRPVHGDVLPWESRAMRTEQPEPAAVAGPSAPVSPMAKMALALREKSAAERNNFDRRVQSGEWGAMPEPSTEADALPNHVAEVKGDDAIRILRWSNRVGAFDYPVGTKLYATPTQAAPQPVAQQGDALRPFAEIGAWMLARPQVPDDTPVVTVKGINGCDWVLTRGDFKRAALATQPQEAAPYDHGPQAATIEEATRDVGKWLNERPNRPLDLRHVAMLVHHAQAAPSQDAEDAARYRWLRDGNNVKQSPAMKIASTMYGLEWDAAIDEARARQEEK